MKERLLGFITHTLAVAMGVVVALLVMKFPPNGGTHAEEPPAKPKWEVVVDKQVIWYRADKSFWLDSQFLYLDLEDGPREYCCHDNQEQCPRVGDHRNVPNHTRYYGDKVRATCRTNGRNRWVVERLIGEDHSEGQEK